MTKIQDFPLATTSEKRPETLLLLLLLPLLPQQLKLSSLRNVANVNRAE